MRNAKRLTIAAALAMIVGGFATLPPLLGGDLPADAKAPLERDGQELVGTKFPDLRFDRWLNTPDTKPAPTQGRVVLYRWWTDTCPYCAATLPAIELLRTKYEKRGLEVVAVYHPKPRRDVPDTDVLKATRRIGYSGVVAIDIDWSQLRKAWLTGAPRPATSVTLLVDAQGVIRFVHPGMAYFPSDKPADAQENRDFHELELAIEAVLKGN